MAELIEKEAAVTPDVWRERAKLELQIATDEESFCAACRHLAEAAKLGDVEASFLLARMCLKKQWPFPSEEKQALQTLEYLAIRKRYFPARVYLNAYCQGKYETLISADATKKREGPLVDFEGKPIKICRKGLLTPIDAVLEHRDGKNVLTLSVNLLFLLDSSELMSERLFRKAVVAGVRAWEGEYTVFGGQTLFVEVNVTENDQIIDSVWVLPATKSIRKRWDAVGDAPLLKGRLDTLKSRRSFFTGLLRPWSVHSKKWIVLQSQDDRFSDCESVMHVMKHEFGHALGLGDLYFEEKAHLLGVKEGTYRELDGYAVEEKDYNLVMCNHWGPIGNNDIEMVVLAFRENKAQLYQKQKRKGKISKALGRGN